MKIHGCQDVRDGDAVPENLRAMFSGFGKRAFEGIFLPCFCDKYDVVRNVSGVLTTDRIGAENRGLIESSSKPSFVPHRVYQTVDVISRNALASGFRPRNAAKTTGG